jgi:hypothetical protein
VRRLVRLLDTMSTEGDARAARAGRQARRTLQQMQPGYERQPVLVLHRPKMNDACGICGFWRCHCGGDAAPAPAHTRVMTDRAPAASGSGQCSTCGATFPGWNGGVCDACRALGR